MVMSFEEKSVWVQFGAMGVVLGGYFALAGVMLGRGVDEVLAYVPLFVVSSILMGAVMAIGLIGTAILKRPEPRDERDRLIEWRSEARSSWVLGAGMLIGVGCMAASVSGAWVANLLLASMFCSEMLKYALQIVAYRRGA